MTKVSQLLVRGGRVSQDPRFQGTPVPWTATLPTFRLIGFGRNGEEAARDILAKHARQQQQLRLLLLLRQFLLVIKRS